MLIPFIENARSTPGGYFSPLFTSPSDFSCVSPGIYTNKIDRKHVDFLLCDVVTMQPLVGIELDDSSHQREDRQSRDEFVDGVYAAAGLPLLHIPVKRAYVAAEIERLIAPYLGKTAARSASPVTAVEAIVPTAPNPIRPLSPASSLATPAAASPRCPKCGSEMILRTAKSGANAGGRFWGCSNYPTCRGMVAANPQQG